MLFIFDDSLNFPIDCNFISIGIFDIELVSKKIKPICQSISTLSIDDNLQ